ncbi:hypothetical protein ACFX15_010122 [Malus domestica]
MLRHQLLQLLEFLIPLFKFFQTSMLDSHSPFHDDFVAKMILNKIISGHSGYPMPMISCHTPAMISSDAIPPMEDVDNQKTKP